jgi:glycosyltransferase involved in cell wall biosynthesis
MRPFVSILIPVYNCRQWVAQAISSALAQTWPNKEVIVLDDGSTDGSLEVVRRHKGRIQVANQPNSGQNKTRNRLTTLSKGDWLVYLDADDELAPDSVERKIEARDGAVAVYGSMDIVIVADGQRVKSKKRIAQDYEDPWVAAFRWKFPNTSAFAFERKALLEAGGWNEAVQNCTDYALYFPLLLRGGRFNAAPDAWSLYRQWSTTQAVFEAPLRRMISRLRVMWKAAVELKEVGGLSAERDQAFLDACLKVIRTIYPYDAQLARREHQRLLDWNRAFQPSVGIFAPNYCRAYKALGFRTAELLAGTARVFKSK